MTAPVVDAESLTRHDDEFHVERINGGESGGESIAASAEETPPPVNGCGIAGPSSTTNSAEPVGEPPLQIAASSTTSATATTVNDGHAAKYSNASDETTTTTTTTTTSSSQSPTPFSADTFFNCGGSSSSSSFLPVDEVTRRLEIHSDLCFFCRGFYGPSFGQSVCGPCHAFLFPERAGEIECARDNDGARQEDKDDSGDSGNEEPTDFFGAAAAAAATDRSRRGGGGGGGGAMGLSSRLYSTVDSVAFIDAVDVPCSSVAFVPPSNFHQNPSGFEIGEVPHLPPLPPHHPEDLHSPSSSSTSSSSSSSEDGRHDLVAVANDRMENGVDDVVKADFSGPSRYPRGSPINNGAPLLNVRSEKLAEKIIQMTTIRVSS